MSNRTILAAVMLAIATSAGAARDRSGKEECPTLDHQEMEDLLRKAPSCRRAGALFEVCQSGASGDVSLGAIVTAKCEGDFLNRLSASRRRAYDRAQQQCRQKYANQAGTMYRSFEAFCGASVARNYSTRYLGAGGAGR
jgi:hypothetical protein